MLPPREAGLRRLGPLVLVLVVLFLFVAKADASTGDNLRSFKQCVKVCKQENCGEENPTPIPFHRRLLLWNCDHECDYTCQHIITARRIENGNDVVQFHGKWPFVRFWGMQEPLSVIFSLANLWAHITGLQKLRTSIPKGYSLRPYYIRLAYVGIAAWIFSSIFHTRDFPITEELDYFAAGASVLYGLYYTVVRIFRLDQKTARKASLLRVWTILCCALYAAHVWYLKFVRWNYTYNMAANVVAGGIQNLLWSWFSWKTYSTSRRPWATWPGIVVAWVVMAMSMELLDFPPLWGSLDAHSLWHLGTIVPTFIWYNFLVKDAQEDIAGMQRLKS